MNAARRIVLFGTLFLWSWLVALASNSSASETRIWEVFNIEYNAPATEATDLSNRTETPTSDYDSAPIHSAITEEMPTGANRALFGQIVEFKAAETTEQLPATLYHYTSSENVESIMQNGLGRPGREVFTTPAGDLSPVQAQIDLALPPNRGYPNALIGIDTGVLQDLGISPIAGPRNVLGTSTGAGGGTEIIFGQTIPPAALRIIPYP